MQALSTIFVCEFITGGGLCGAPLAQSLLAEGAMMRDALLRDLRALPYRVVTTCDSRVKPSEYAFETLLIDDGMDVWVKWSQCIEQADVVWLIAPETEGILYRLVALAIGHGKPIVGSGLSAIAISSSKYQTHRHFKAHGIRTIPTWTVAEWQTLCLTEHNEQPWLTKPDDGAGCDDTYIFEGNQALSRWLAYHPDKHKTHVIQPYQPGIAASIGVVSDGRRVYVLSCNLQTMQRNGQRLIYLGGVVNGAIEYQRLMERFAQQVQEALPSLAGYYGIDVLIHADASAQTSVTLIEINPRLTTTYVPLAKAMHTNPAKLILDIMLNPNTALPAYQHARVVFEVHHAS